jgi:hypothetical protein
VTKSVRFDIGANNLFDKKAPTVPNYNGRPANGSNVYDAPYRSRRGASTAAITTPAPRSTSDETDGGGLRRQPFHRSKAGPLGPAFSFRHSGLTVCRYP